MFQFKFTVLKFAFLTAVLSLMPLTPLVIVDAAPDSPVLSEPAQKQNPETNSFEKRVAHEATKRYLPRAARNSRVH